MMAIVAVPLALAGLVGYVVASTRLALWRRHPWEFLALSAAGVVAGGVAFARAPAVGTAIAFALSAAVLAFFSWFVFRYSMYGTREDRPRVGERFPEFTLPSSDGGTFGTAAARGRKLLVLCYRGAW